MKLRGIGLCGSNFRDISAEGVNSARTRKGGPLGLNLFRLGMGKFLLGRMSSEAEDVV